MRREKFGVRVFYFIVLFFYKYDFREEVGLGVKCRFSLGEGSFYDKIILYGKGLIL